MGKNGSYLPNNQSTNQPTNLQIPTNQLSRTRLSLYQKFVQTKTFARFSSKTGKSQPKWGVFIGRDSHVLIGRDGHETLPWLSNNHPTPIYQPTNLPSPPQPIYLSIGKNKRYFAKQPKNIPLLQYIYIFLTNFQCGLPSGVPILVQKGITILVGYSQPKIKKVCFQKKLVNIFENL